MCILTNYPVTPHLFRCLILTGNLSREVSPPSGHSAVIHPSLPVSRAYLMTRAEFARGSSTVRPRPRPRSRRAPDAPEGPQSHPERQTIIQLRIRAPDASAAILGRSRPLQWTGKRMPAARTRARANTGRSGAFRARCSRVPRCLPEMRCPESRDSG
jgi:hypothetical protein